MRLTKGLSAIGARFNQRRRFADGFGVPRGPIDETSRGAAGSHRSNPRQIVSTIIAVARSNWSSLTGCSAKIQLVRTYSISP
jgi:hypothetical protein